MNNKGELIGGTVGTLMSATGTALQTQEVLQIVSLVITIVGGLITWIIIPLVTWWKKSKADGKIDKYEVKEGLEIIENGSRAIKETLDDKKKGDN